LDTPTHVAAESFEALVQRCREASGETYLLELQRLTGLVDTNPILRGVTQDILREGKQWIDANNDDEAELRRALVTLRNDLATAFVQLAASAEIEPPADGPPNLDVSLRYEQSLAYFDKLAGQHPPSRRSILGGRFENTSACKALHDILKIQLNGLDSRGVGEKEKRRAFWRRLNDCGNLVDWLHRERMNFLRASAGWAWKLVLRVVEQVNPRPEPEPAEIDYAKVLNEAFEMLGQVPFEKILYGQGSRVSGEEPSAEELRHFEEWRTESLASLTLIHDEVQYRLRVRASVDWALSRYAARAMWYRGRHLRTLVASLRGKKRSLERVLVEDAAAFLFDQGLLVLTEVSLGVSRLDILGISRGRPLLVEAKVYADASSARKAVKGGLAQLQDYASRLSAGWQPTENCLLVFRLGGPRVEIQGDLRFGTHEVRIELIDLTDAAAGGSRSKAPLVIRAQDAMAPPPTAGNRKRSGGRQRSRQVPRGRA